MDARKLFFLACVLAIAIGFMVAFRGLPFRIRKQFNTLPRHTQSRASLAAALISTPDPTPALPTARKKLEGEACWEKIYAQVKESPDFRVELESRMRDVIDPWFYRKDQPPSDVPMNSAANLFLLGLARGGILQGRQVEKNDDRAIELLERASRLDPDNSAPILFAAVVESRRGRSDSALALIDLAKTRSRHFDSYIATVAKAVMLNVRTPVDYIAAIEINSTTPVPDYNELRDLLKATKSTSFAEQFMRDGLDPRKKNELIDYVSLEYATGLSLLKGDPIASSYPNLKELWETKRAGLSLIGEEAEQALEKSCDIHALEPLMQRLEGLR